MQLCCLCTDNGDKIKIEYFEEVKNLFIKYPETLKKVIKITVDNKFYFWHELQAELKKLCDPLKSDGQIYR